MFRVGENPNQAQQYTARRGVYAVLPGRSGLLLTLQTDADTGPDLQLPGGGIDPGESPVAALHREVLEETGWTIARPRLMGQFQRYTYMPEYDLWAQKICMIYLARPVQKLGPPTEPFHTALWTPALDALETLGNLGDRSFVAQLITGEPAARWARSRPASERGQRPFEGNL